MVEFAALARTFTVKSRFLQDDGEGDSPPYTKGRSRLRLLGLACIAPALILPFLQQKPAAVTSAKATAAKPTVAKPAPATGLQPYIETLPNSVVKVNMIPIPAGSVTIGANKIPIKPFWIADTETTWEAFDVFVASGAPSVAYDQTEFAPDAIARPSKSYILPDLGWGHHGYPAINVSFLSVQMFCRWLSSKTGKKYRVPTEAEWEYACRTGAAGPVKLTKSQLEKCAWYAENSDMMAHPVKKKLPNAWKLYDMYGNPGEWATDAANKPLLCGGTFREAAAAMVPGTRKRWTPKWQETDPQLPKSRWWLSDGMFCGFRVVCEP
jgi:formylglycine-generating enzyme required for sulfatase activity